MRATEDLRIRSIREIITPAMLHAEFPLTARAAETVFQTREAIQKILHGGDDRLLVIAGPCSIHDPAAAREYAQRLARPRAALCRDLLVVMRVYFEKPRTIVGWKGMINDPDLDGSFNINKGLRLARELLVELNDSGVPAAVECLDILTPQYLMDSVSWAAIGARTTESQVHRELASGLSCPVGFKNGTDGNLSIAADAVRSARHPHCFLSFTQDAQSAIFATRGNADTHVVLRGGSCAPNYDAASVQQAVSVLEEAGLEKRLMIDFSHANSRKRPERQRKVCRAVAEQVAQGRSGVFGVMIESHLKAGRQDAIAGQPLIYGQSITDGCIGWDDTVEMLEELAAAVRTSRRHCESAASVPLDARIGA